jgi:alanine-synthesizing transaminase
MARLSAIISPMFSRRTAWQLELNRFTLAHHEALRSGRHILDLTISNPTRAGFEYDERAILDSLRNSQSLEYDPQPKGLLRARKAVSDYYKDKGDRCDPENLVLTTSTSEAYSYVFRLLCNPGDEVLVPKPSYPLFDFLADLQDVKLVPFQCIYDHGWQIDWPALESCASDRSRAIALVHPNNPTGAYIAANDRTQLNELCREHGLALIVDEVFLDYAHDGKPRQGFVANNAALTFTLSGLSKISALPQMKLAWIAVSGPEALAEAAMERLEVIADTFLSLSAPIQLAAAAMLGQRRGMQAQILSRVRRNLSELDRQLAKQKSCTRLNTEAGWYAVVRIPDTGSDEGLAIKLLQERSVLVHPGHFYDFSRDGYLILSLITPEEQFSDGISRILDFMGE